MYKFKINQKVKYELFGIKKEGRIIERTKNEYGNWYRVENEMGFIHERKFKSK